MIMSSLFKLFCLSLLLQSLTNAFVSIPKKQSHKHLSYDRLGAISSTDIRHYKYHRRQRQRSTHQRSTRSNHEDLYSAVHRKEYEMKAFKTQHTSLSDPINVAMSYHQEGQPPMKLAKALRRVYDDPNNPANPNYVEPNLDEETLGKDKKREKQLRDIGMAELPMRRGSFIVDIKRKSELSSPGEVFTRFDDAGMVAEAMVRLGADVVFVNVDYGCYGGDITELKSAIRSVRKASPTAAVVMKDIVVDEVQLGIAKEAGADGVLLIASVLGPALDNFLNLATVIGLETIVECHTRNEVQRSLDALAQNILVSNHDRISGNYYPDQAIKLAGMFPGSGGPIISLATGGINTPDQMKKHLAVGYDGVVIGKAVMGNPSAAEYVRVVRDRTLLPTEFSQWGLEHVEFDVDGNIMNPPKPKDNIPSPNDDTSFQ